ncbi:MAG: hypothetical protein ACLRYN_02820 [Clostridium perfringens]|uniref:hypothetical protein n=1 Tax=Clostridium perfringens TaxID=1502 RepID=UPI003A2DFE6C
MLVENEKTISNWKCRDKWNIVLQKNTDNNMKKEPIAEEVKEVLGNAELTDKQGLFYISYIKRFKEIRA